MLAEVSALADAGMFLRAYQRTRPFGPLHRWTWSARAMAIAARLAHHLGAERLYRRLAVRAVRTDPRDPHAAVTYGFLLHELRGPYALWTWARGVTLSPSADAATRADLVALRAIAAAELRDFERASELVDEAAAIDPETPEFPLLRAAILEQEDRYAEATQVALAALAKDPGQRRMAQQTAHLLMLEGRKAEALDVLSRADARFECASLAMQLTGLHVEGDRLEEAELCLDRFEQLSPLSDREHTRLLALRRADCAYRRGDFERARRLLANAEDPFFTAFRARLEHPEDHRRVKLSVPFVRQHERTCSPATLAAISRFWSQSAEHLAIAGAICYDGTPDHRERAWADDNGWITREFRVTWDAARALIDRGLPFVLSTYGTSHGHAQAVIGYDVLRGSLILRDPFAYGDIEVVAEQLLASQAPTGPRALALVPASEGARLDGLDLPEAALYDRLHRLQRLLFTHDRKGAARELAALREEAPDHRLVHAGRRAIAVYDEDTAAILACAEERLRAFPEAFSAAVEVVVTMRATAPRAARVERLEALVTRSPDPIFLELLSDELAADDREYSRARRLAWRAVLRGRTRAESHGVLASLCWDRRERDEGLDLFRFAACLRERDEGSARRYALAARAHGRAEEALRFMRARASRHGGQSHAPILTLFHVLDLFGLAAEAFEVLDAAIARRPDDAALALAAVPLLASAGRIARARELLAQAEGKSPEGAWVRTAAALAGYDAGLPEQLTAWREVLAREPLAVDAHGHVAGLLEIIHGREEARRHLAQARETFPHSHPLAQLWITWLEREDPAFREAELRKVLAVEPDDAWALRELAVHLGALRRFDEAFALCDEARVRAPLDVRDRLVRGHLHLLRGQVEDARAAFRDAFALEPDADLAITNLLVLAPAREERDREVQSLARALVERSPGGAGIVAWYESARPLADPARLDELTAEIRRARPELGVAWSVSTKQLLASDRLDEAWDVAREAAARFPLSPEAWLDLSHVAAARGDAEEELRALVRAHETSPLHGVAARALAICHERAGRSAEARAVLGRMAAREARDVATSLFLASLEWAAGEREAALERVRGVLRHSPTSFEALHRFGDFCAELGDDEGALRLARENVAASPTSPALRLVLAQLLLVRGRADEATAELDAGLAHDPFAIELRDVKVYSMAAAGRFDEARAACAAPEPGGHVPVELEGRAAWLRVVSGDLPGGIAAMREVVGRRPDFAWGHKKLASFHDAAHDHAAQMESCRELVKISPRDGAAHAALAEARLRAGDRRGARRSLERALTLGLEDAHATQQLCELEIEEGDLEGAERSLRLLRRIVGPVAGRDEVKVALAAGDEDRAIDAFRSLCLAPPVPAAVVLHARRLLLWAGLGARVQRELGELVADPNVSRSVAETWGRASVLRDDGALEARLAELGTDAPGARAAAIGAILLHGAQRERWRLLRLLLRKRVLHGRPSRRWMRAHPELWSAGATALLACNLPFTAALWLSLCRISQADSPALLLPVARTLRAIGKPRRALAVSRRAARSDEHSPAASWHRAWIAFDAAVSGDDAQAAELLAGVNEQHLLAPETHLLETARLVLHLRSVPQAERPGAFLDIEARLGDARANLLRFGRAGRLCAERAERRIALDVRSYRTVTWAFGALAAQVFIAASVAALILWISPRYGAGVACGVAILWLLPRAWEIAWPPSFGAGWEEER